MKTSFVSITIGYLTAIMLVSCESHEQKADDAFENVKQEKLTIKDSTLIRKEIVQEVSKAEPVKKTENVDEWTKFKMETEKKIHSNENKIKEIKSIPDQSSKLLRRVSSIEKDNNDLRRQMNEYNEDMKVKWENFKTIMNHQANEIDIELKDLTTNNKK